MSTKLLITSAEVHELPDGPGVNVTLQKFLTEFFEEWQIRNNWKVVGHDLDERVKDDTTYHVIIEPSGIYDSYESQVR